MFEIPNVADEPHFDLTNSLAQVESLVATNDISTADEWIRRLNPTNRLLLLSRLNRETRRVLFQKLPPEIAADYLHDIPEVQAVHLLERMAPDQAADILEELPKDEQADLVGEMPSETQDSILAEMDSADAADVRELIEYEDNEAGGMMIVEFVAVPAHQSVGDVTRFLQNNSASYSDYDVQYIYVVDKLGRDGTGVLQGVLRLRDLVLSDSDVSVASLMIRDPVAVNTRTSLKDLHQFFVDHSYVGVPVSDENRRLLGVLRRSDVEQAMAEQYAEDYLKSQGIVDEELRTMPLGLRSRRRLTWLSINIVLNIIAATVIALYQDTLAQVIALAVFLPIVSDMSGCSGNQAVAVSMRELSLGLVQPKEVWRVWVKEAGVGIINGLCLGVLLGAAAWLWQGKIMLGMVVGSALMLNTLIAVSLGGTLPLLMKLLKLDPALASGPILTTVTDMCGFFLVLSFASLCLAQLV